MRHRLQSRQVIVGIALTVLMSAAFCAIVVTALSGPLPEGIPARGALPFAHRAPTAAPPATVGQVELIVAAAAMFAVLCYGAAAILLLNGLFRRTGAGEAFFLVSFAISLSVEVLRLAVAVFVFRGGLPSLSVAATRVVYMGRLFGLSSLLFSTLCGLGMRYADYATLSRIGVLLSVVMGAIVPIDSTSITTGLLHAVADGGGLLSVGATATVVVAVGALGSPLVRGEGKYAGYGMGVVCLIIARELLALGGIAPSVAGIVGLVGGTYLLSRSLERVYLGIS